MDTYQDIITVQDITDLDIMGLVITDPDIIEVDTKSVNLQLDSWVSILLELTLSTQEWQAECHRESTP